MRVADFGAGSGAYTLAMAERVGAHGRVYAIDIQKDLLKRLSHEVSRAGLKNVDVLWADLETLKASKLADHSIDFVLISNLLFQTHDKIRVLREAKRIVHMKGRVAIIEWSESFGGMGPIASDVLKKNEAAKLLIEAGLELVEEFRAGAHHYGLLCKPAHSLLV